MKKFILPLFALMLLSCGGEEESVESNEDSNNETDTTSVDTIAVEDETESVMFFEDYAQFDTKTKLYEEFGEENIVDDEAWYAEGTVHFVTSVLTDPATGNKIQFTWDEKDEETLSFIETWRLDWKDENAVPQKVETKEGLYTGMPLKELIDWNGEDFRFAGFGWDYAGGVFANEDEGKLGGYPVDVTLDMLDEGWETFPHLIGDADHSTGDDGVKGAPVVIGSMTYHVQQQ